MNKRKYSKSQDDSEDSESEDKNNAAKKYLLRQAAKEANYPAVIFLTRHGYLDDIYTLDDDGKTPLERTTEGYEKDLANKYACFHSFDISERFKVKKYLDSLRLSLKNCETEKDRKLLIRKSEVNVTKIFAKEAGLMDD